MKNIVVGGLCLKDEDSKIFFTDSGRSSLFSIYSLSDIKRVIKNIVLFKIDYV